MNENLLYCLIGIGIAFITCGLSIVIPLISFENPISLNTVLDYISVAITYVLNLDIRIVLGTLILAIGCAITNYAGFKLYLKFKK